MGIPLKLLGAAAVMTALMVPAPGAAAGGRLVACPETVSATHASVFRVNGLDARGVSCAGARRIATKVAGELVAGKPLTVAGSTAIDVTTTSACPSCASRALVTVQVRGGSVTFTVSAKLKSTTPSLTLPPFPLPFPLPVPTPFPTTPQAPQHPMTV